MNGQMLDEDPAKRKAWGAESSALVYTTCTLQYQPNNKTYRSIRKTKIIKCSYKLERNIKYSSIQTKGADRSSDDLIRKKWKLKYSTINATSSRDNNYTNGC